MPAEQVALGSLLRTNVTDLAGGKLARVDQRRRSERVDPVPAGGTQHLVVSN